MARQRGEDGVDDMDHSQDTEVELRMAMEVLQRTRGDQTQEEFAKDAPGMAAELARLEAKFSA